jgi:hypothetical protein
MFPLFYEVLASFCRSHFKSQICLFHDINNLGKVFRVLSLERTTESQSAEKILENTVEGNVAKFKIFNNNIYLSTCNFFLLERILLLRIYK